MTSVLELGKRPSYKGPVSAPNAGKPITFAVNFDGKTAKFTETASLSPEEVVVFLKEAEKLILLYEGIHPTVILDHGLSHTVKSLLKEKYFVRASGEVATVYSWVFHTFPGGKGKIAVSPKILASGTSTTVVEDGQVWK